MGSSAILGLLTGNAGDHGWPSILWLLLPGDMADEANRANHPVVSAALQKTEPTAPPLDELDRDPLAFVAHWVEYASTSSVG